MKSAALALLAIACSDPPPVKVVETTEAPWFWFAERPSGNWRLPGRVMGIAFADAGHAIAATETSLISIDLATGAVSAPVLVMPPDAWIHAVARVGGRVVGFGQADDKPAAWELSLSPLAARKIELDDRKSGEPDTRTGGGVAVSPDGARVIVCTSIRPPTIRDAKTLATLRVLDGVGCTRVHFEDATHAVLEDGGPVWRVDVTTGARTYIADNVALVFGGPRGQRFKAMRDGFAILDGARVVRRDVESGAWNARSVWTTDGARVVSFDHETLRSRDPRAPERDLVVRLPGWLQPDLAIDDRRLLLVEGTAILAIDVLTGAVEQPRGELRDVMWVAPHDGAIVTSSDRIRRRRGADVIGETTGWRTGGGTPIAVLDEKQVVLWDPVASSRVVYATFETFPTHATQTTSGLVVVAGQTLHRGGAPWLTLTERIAVEAVDPTATRIVVGDNDGLHVLEPASRRVIELSRLGLCSASNRVAFSPDGTRLAVSNHSRVVVFDVRTWQRTAEIALGSHANEWTLTGPEELVIARQHEVEVWDLRTRTSRSWLSPLGESPVDVVVDPAGRELAIASARDQLLWLDLAGLRAHAEPARTAQPLPAEACAVLQKPARYDAFVRP